MNIALNFSEILSSFLVLFVVIDITGAIPIIIDLKTKRGGVSAIKAAIFSFLILSLFLVLGDAVLRLFQVDVQSFAVAGAIILFVMAVEMIFGVEIFKNDGPVGTGATLVPMVFPLIAGAATITTLLSLRAEYHTINIGLALVLNMIVVYLVIKYVGLVEKLVGKNGVYILRKFFGIILLAVSVRMFINNITQLIN